jgi:predicted aspartyl protease
LYHLEAAICPKTNELIQYRLPNEVRDILFMGMFKVAVKIVNPQDTQRFFEEDFWVDTGALYTFVPEERLKEIGLIPLRSRELILADGRRDRRLLGEALFTIPELNETLTCPLIFAPPGSLYLLGATALENFGVDADTAARRLKPITAVIGGFLAARPKYSVED